MRPQTENRYLDRVDRAARLLANRLDRPPTAEELAAAVGVSRFHFQRIYRAATGETVLDTLRRLRAIRALELLDEGTSVTRVAGAVGYDTPQAFARAFREWTGTAPSRARGRGSDLVEQFRRAPGPAPKPLEIEIASMRPLRLTVVRTRRPFGPLNDVYESLFDAVAAQDRLDAVEGIFGLPENDPESDPEGLQEHVAAVSLGDAELAGFDTVDIGEAPALRLRHTGPFDTIDESAVAMYGYVIERNLELADIPPLHHHLDDPDEVAPERLRTDLYLALIEESRGASL